MTPEAPTRNHVGPLPPTSRPTRRRPPCRRRGCRRQHRPLDDAVRDPVILPHGTSRIAPTTAPATSRGTVANSSSGAHDIPGCRHSAKPRLPGTRASHAAREPANSHPGVGRPLPGSATTPAEERQRRRCRHGDEVTSPPARAAAGRRPQP